MACSYCGNQFCTVACMATGQGAMQGIAANPINAQGVGAVLGGGLVTQYYPSGLQAQTPTYDNATNNFLKIIEDKSDTDACIAFLEQQRALRQTQLAEMERLRKQFEKQLEDAEKEFMTRCQKYRPSITDELLIRIKKLKAFF